MPVGIKTKQVAGITGLMALTVILLSGWYLSELARVRLEESKSRAELLANLIYQRAREVVNGSQDPNVSLRTDSGLRTILESSVYSKNVNYAAIVDPNGVVIAHNAKEWEGLVWPDFEDLVGLLQAGTIAQFRAIYTPEGKTFEYRQQLLRGETEFASIRIGINTSLILLEFKQALTPALGTALGVLLAAIVVATVLAQIVLQPIHVIRSGLQRLGRGEVNVNVDLPGELTDLGDSFKAVSDRLAEGRTQLEGQRATLESVVEHLEDAVALFAPEGRLLFANPAMRAALPAAEGSVSTLLPADHPYRTLVEEAFASRESRGPLTVHVPQAGERLILAHPVEDADHRPIGVMLVSRNLAYLSQVETTLSYSRKLQAIFGLSAGIAHEVKNPLNATMIHLELLKMQLAQMPEAMQHLSIIAAQVRRLDEVVQGFLKFARPEELKLQPVPLEPLIEELMPVIRAEAEKNGVDVRVEVPAHLPPVSGDPGPLQQAFLNLALNACQAMPHGGRLRIAAASKAGRRIETIFEDTGVGIAPDHLGRIFDLYFTTKEGGSGIGLSMVYRTVQLHDGVIEVQSAPGRGTTFRVTLREAQGILGLRA